MLYLTPPPVATAAPVVVQHVAAVRWHRDCRRFAHPGPRLARRPPRGSSYVPRLPRRDTGARRILPAFAAGELALGVSVAKASRWLVLGGHGRNGAG